MFNALKTRILRNAAVLVALTLQDELMEAVRIDGAVDAALVCAWSGG